jgi:colicin import membrane protein
MMNSRGAPPPPEVGALIMLGELVTLLRDLDPIVTKRLADLKAEEERVAHERADLAATSAAYREHAAASESGLDKRHAEVLNRENVAKVQEATLAKTLEELAAREKALAVSEAAFAERVAAQEKAEKDFAAQCKADRAIVTSERKNADKELARQRQQLETAAREIITDATRRAEEITTAADVAFRTREANVELTEQRLTLREAAIHERAAQLRAALGGE